MRGGGQLLMHKHSGRVPSRPLHPQSCQMTDAASCLCWDRAEGPGGADIIVPSPPGPFLQPEKHLQFLFILGYLRKSRRRHTSEVYPEHGRINRRFCLIGVGSTGWEVGAGASLPQDSVFWVHLPCTGNIGKILSELWWGTRNLVPVLLG